MSLPGHDPSSHILRACQNPPQFLTHARSTARCAAWLTRSSRQRRHRRPGDRRYPATRRATRRSHRQDHRGAGEGVIVRAARSTSHSIATTCRRSGRVPWSAHTSCRWTLDGKRVVIVDDVLYTGRTVRAALDELADFGRPVAHRARRAHRPRRPRTADPRRRGGTHAWMSPAGQRVDVFVEEAGWTRSRRVADRDDA